MSPDAVERMTVERVEQLTAYWGEYPPVHVLVRGAVGYKAKREGGKRRGSAAEIAARFGGEVVKRGP